MFAKRAALFVVLTLMYQMHSVLNVVPHERVSFALHVEREVHLAIVEYADFL